ncbi:MAG: hypothetical protein EOO50_05130 [Flavobacterium sp.]|uniref:LIC_10190 family membrane protein n=1 Tax=Flavobacterium sp. TaxID=239 RepID=UPI0012104678|nr:hypothetical protein [Flavobacterium sp.]RZJ67666.1 MAG: hypothetical protein EOO50_05130 [Flavobacterium sp.]
MLLIALTFVYIAFTTINFGAFTNVFFRTKTTDFATVSMLGLFGVTMFTSVWAIFDRVNWEFHVVLLLLNIALFFVFRNSVTAIYRALRIEFGKLPKTIKLFFAVSGFLIIAKSASAPYILDNESYYIQTVKWLNEYGFVPGLANLHIFLAQMSGWHIAQSAFSFSFLYPNFNDLSGYCLLLANLFAVLRLCEYFKTDSKIALIIGLLPVANVFFLQFSGAPAADIPIFVLTFMACFYFVGSWRDPNRNSFNLLVILILFALFIKITVIAIVLLPIFLLFKNVKELITLRIAILGILVLSLFVIRNCIASGFPLFPLPNTFGFDSDYAMPKTVANFFFVESRPYPFGLTKSQYDAMPFYEIFLTWLRLPKLHGFFNTVGVMLAILSPVFIFKFRNTKPMWLLYVTMLFQLVLLLYLSPQYRFFMNFILFFGFFCTACLLSKRIAVQILLWVSCAAAAVIVFVPVKLDSLTKNKYANRSTSLSAKNLIFPHSNSKSDTEFESLKNGNLNYFSPVNNDFFWKTGDGPLPCVNKDQVEFFEKNFGRRTQLREKEISAGFISDSLPTR